MGGTPMPAHLSTLGECATPEIFKEKIWNLLGDAISKYEPTGTDVMFATYIDPGKTAGGIFLGDKTRQESLFQSNAGLIVKLGPLAHMYKGNGWKWEDCERKPQIGDWITVRFADCWEMHLDGGSFRLVDPENIRGYIETPAIIGNRPTKTSRQQPDDLPDFNFPVRSISTNSEGISTPSLIIPRDNMGGQPRGR